MRQRGRAIPRLICVYEDLHTILAQYDEYRRKGYHHPLDEEDEEEDDELDSDGNEARAEETAEKRR